MLTPTTAKNVKNVFHHKVSCPNTTVMSICHVIQLNVHFVKNLSIVWIKRKDTRDFTQEKDLIVVHYVKKLSLRNITKINI